MRVEGANHRDQVVGGLADRQYGVGHVALRREGWWMAALLACGEGAALSHRTAAQAWGLTMGPTLPIDVTTSTDHGRKHRQITTHRMLLAPLDALLRDNLRLTTPSRTIVDLAATLQGRALRETVERAQDLRRFDPNDIRDTLARGPRRPGTRRLHDLITSWPPTRTTPAATSSAGSSRSYARRGFPSRLATTRSPAAGATSRGPTSAWSSRPTGTATTPHARPSAATTAATGSSRRWAGGP
jgi:hypothetical protein